MDSVPAGLTDGRAGAGCQISIIITHSLMQLTTHNDINESGKQFGQKPGYGVCYVGRGDETCILFTHSRDSSMSSRNQGSGEADMFSENDDGCVRL